MQTHHNTTQTKRNPVGVNPHGEGYIYRGFRLVPNRYSPATGRPTSTQKGWICPDFRAEGMSRCEWYPTLADFAEDVDRTYAMAAEGKARNDRKAALGRACENLNPHEAAEVRTLVAECNRKQAAAQAAAQANYAAQEAAREAQKRLIAAAPDLLAALREADTYLHSVLSIQHDDVTDAVRQTVLAAIARATGR